MKHKPTNGFGPHDQAYRGYIIRATALGAYFVEKDQHLICWADNITDAKNKIDPLVNLTEELGKK